MVKLQFWTHFQNPTSLPHSSQFGGSGRRRRKKSRSASGKQTVTIGLPMFGSNSNAGTPMAVNAAAAGRPSQQVHSDNLLRAKLSEMSQTTPDSHFRTRFAAPTLKTCPLPAPIETGPTPCRLTHPAAGTISWTQLNHELFSFHSLQFEINFSHPRKVNIQIHQGWMKLSSFNFKIIIIDSN